MSKLVWDKIGERFYETGVDHAVLYPLSAAGVYDRGVAWNGITGITESPSGAEPQQHVRRQHQVPGAGGRRGLRLTTSLHVPRRVEECDAAKEIAPGVVAGADPQGLCLSYRTKLGNDVDGQDPTATSCTWSTAVWPLPLSGAISLSTDSPEPINPSWEVTTTPVDVPGFKPTARLIIVSTKADLAQAEGAGGHPLRHRGNGAPAASARGSHQAVGERCHGDRRPGEPLRHPAGQEGLRTSEQRRSGRERHHRQPEECDRLYRVQQRSL